MINVTNNLYLINTELATIFNYLSNIICLLLFTFNFNKLCNINFIINNKILNPFYIILNIFICDD